LSISGLKPERRTFRVKYVANEFTQIGCFIINALTVDYFRKKSTLPGSASSNIFVANQYDNYHQQPTGAVMNIYDKLM